MNSALSNARSDRTVALADGRRITVQEFGAVDGNPVLALHGTPGSRLMFSIAEETAARLGLRLISPDRWGYAGTDPHPRPTLEAWAADAAQLMDALRVSQFAVLGISGGGPYAVATAAVLGRRVRRLALAVPVGPLDEPRLQLNLFHRFLFRGLGRRPALTRAIFRFHRRMLMKTPRRAISLLAVGQSAADRELLRMPWVQDFLSETSRDGLMHGVAGPVIDLDLYSKPWGVPFENITASTRVWIGNDDRLVPPQPARNLARAIPHTVLTELPGQGHNWILRDFGLVLEWLASAGQQELLTP